MNPVVKFARFAQHKANDPRIAKNRNNYNVTEYLDLAYLPDGSEDHLLDVYSPAGSSPETKLPVVIDMHGGAYVSCYKEINRQQGQYFAAQGCRCININYTLFPENDMYGVIREFFSVLDWIKANAEKYGFDTDRVFLTGDSAGGHMVLMVGAAMISEAFRAACGVSAPAVRIQKIAANCPLGDFDVTINDPGAVFKLMKYCLKDSLKDDQYVRNCNVRNYLSEDYPPLFILTTPTDGLLHATTKQLHEDLEARGFAHQYKVYTGRANKLGHVFSVTYPDYEESVEANNDILAFFEIND